ncbi:zinc ribbon domain-containing protein [Ferrimicrobium acidiphilum]|uniref:zinc ribbon domain-containing protein n=1 Tax=Ferrimicrobium acidiphilum TaxID=121039 RepID=UPI003C6D2E59
MFSQRLTDTATSATTAVEVITINPAYTNLRCSVCGCGRPLRIKLSSSVYTNNADVNAANNIVAAGLAVTMRKATSHARSNKTQQPDPMKRATTPKAA